MGAESSREFVMHVPAGLNADSIVSSPRPVTQKVNLDGEFYSIVSVVAQVEDFLIEPGHEIRV